MTFKSQLTAAENHLKSSDKLLKPVIEQHGPCDIEPHEDYYGQLVGNIIGQQLSVKAAAAIRKRVYDLFEGDTPAPEELINASEEELRAAGLSFAKIRYIKDLAERILDGRLDLKHISKIPNDELIVQLTAVKGIGEWSAHMFMMFGLGRLDILPVGDLGIRKAAQQLYGLDSLPDRETLVSLAAKNGWHPYESVASWYLWQSLDNAPV